MKKYLNKNHNVYVTLIVGRLGCGQFLGLMLPIQDYVDTQDSYNGLDNEV